MTVLFRCILIFLMLLTLSAIACGGAASEAPVPTAASDASQQSSGATTTEETTSSSSEEVTLRVGTGFLNSIAPPTRTTAVAKSTTLTRLEGGLHSPTFLLPKIIRLPDGRRLI